MSSVRPLTAFAIAKITCPGRYAVGNGVYLQITGEGAGAGFLDTSASTTGGVVAGTLGWDPVSWLVWPKRVRRAWNSDGCSSMVWTRSIKRERLASRRWR